MQRFGRAAERDMRRTIRVRYDECRILPPDKFSKVYIVTEYTRVRVYVRPEFEGRGW